MYRTSKYLQRDARKRQIGATYEAYVAERLRGEGWQVDETGRNGVNDHGIDLIASKDGVKRYVQCKGWKQTKHIHEDVVAQLFGSVAGIEGTENLGGVEKFIYSPASLDDTAAAEATRLGIEFVRLDFPYDPAYDGQRRRWYHPKTVKHFYHRHRHHR